MVKIIAFNKPFDVHSQFRGEDTQITLANFIQDYSLRVAGRLDRDSEGLMLLTDDGTLNQHITHPKFKQYKTYLAQVDGQITDEAILQLQKGVELSDGLTLPAKVSAIDPPDWLWEREPPIRFRANIPTSWVEIQICEGRNRQVRRMTAAVGFPTLRLIRTQIGSVNLLELGLESGDQRSLEPLFYDEFRHVLQQVKSEHKEKPIRKSAPRSKKDIEEAKQNKKRAKVRAEIFKSDDAKPRRITNGTTRANTKQRGRKGQS